MVVELTGQHLLPGLSLLPPNPGIANELWELLKTLPYEVRYTLYAQWRQQYQKVWRVYMTWRDVISQLTTIFIAMRSFRS